MFIRSVLGVLALVVAFTPLVIGSLALRRRWLPTWSGPPGWLVQVVLVLTACLVTILGLGVLGLFSLVPTALVLAGSGAAMWLVAPRMALRETPELEAPPERLGRPAKVVAVVALSLVAATWGARTYVALSHGMVSIDSLWYHLPLAARYANLHSITGIYHDVDNLSGFYPINGELVHSLGMVLLGNDLLSMVLNIGWGLVALLAAWCIGRPFGMRSVCITTVSVLLGAPAFVGTQPGAAHVDIVGVALVLTVAALLLTAAPRRMTTDPVVLALAAMVVGFAVGTKWTLVPLSVALTLGVVVLLPRNRRLVLSGMWLGIVALLGAFSYVRNLVKEGNPLPPVDLRIGPVGWSSTVPPLEGMNAVAAYLLDGDAWRAWLLPGLSRWFGYAWWAVLALVAAGLVVALWRGPGPVVRMLGIVGVVGVVGYLVQPQLLDLLGQPYFFSANIRYASAALALGLVLLPLSPLLSHKAVAWSVPAVSLAVLLVMQLDPTLWPTDLRELRWEEPVQGADAVAGVLVGLVALVAGLAWVLRPTRAATSGETAPGAGDHTGAANRAHAAAPRSIGARRTWAAVGAIAVSALAVLGLDRWYLEHRYTSPDAPTPFIPEHWRSWEWARDIEGARIGFKHPTLSYPLYGNRLSNHVEPFPGFEPPPPGEVQENTPALCRQFLELVNRRRYDYVVLFGSLAPAQELPPDAPSFDESTPELGWLASDAGAELVLDRPLESVFRINEELDPASCSTP